MAEKSTYIPGIMKPGNVISAFGNIFAGISALDAANENASLLEQQGLLVRDDYNKQAALTREEGSRIRAKQTMEYISSGVEVVGTPQLVLKETLSKTMAKAGALEVTGAGYSRLYSKKAQITRKEGQAALVSGVMSAAASLI